MIARTQQGGREVLSKLTDVPIVSLAVIDGMEGDSITFAPLTPASSVPQ
jgi:hypothetical protein